MPTSADPALSRFLSVPIDRLLHVPGNPKTHDLDLLKASIGRFGFRVPVLIEADTNYVIAGNGRLDALLALAADGAEPPAGITAGKDGTWLVPVLTTDSFASDAERDAYVIADNQATIAGGWDPALLAASLDAATAQEDGLTGTGFTPAMLAALHKQLIPVEFDGVRDLNPDERFAVYESAVICQIVLHYDRETFERLVPVLDAARKRHGIDTNAELVQTLLEQDASGAEAADGSD